MATNNVVEIRITASGADQAARILQGVAKEGGQIGTVVAGGAKRAEDSLNSLGGSAKRVFEIFTGFTAANLFGQIIDRTRDLISETAKLGLEAKVQEDAFARLSKSVGVAGDALVEQMNRAAGGILNTSDVMIAAAKALNQSLQPDQIVNLMTIARQQSKLAGIDVSQAFNDITNAIANQQPRALKQLGIVVDMDAAFKKHAATLGVEVERLNELGKTQAIYNAVAEQTKNSVAALTSEALTQSEQIQKMSAAWKQVKEDIGKVVVDAGFAILKWLQDVAATIGDITPALQALGTVWGATWANAKASLEPFMQVFGGLKPLVNEITEVIAEMGVGANLVFRGIIGPATFFGSVLQDIANKTLPDFAKASDLAEAAQAAAKARWQESITALEALRASFRPATSEMEAAAKATTNLGTAADMGKNKLADVGNQIKPLIPDVKALGAVVAGAAAAFKALSDEVARGVFPEDEFTKMNAPLDAFRDKMRDQLSALGLSKTAIQALDAALAQYQATLVNSALATRQAKDEATAFYEGLKEQIDAARLSVEAMEFSYEKWLAALNAGGALDEATEFYKNLAENTESAAKSFESMQTPIDNASRASQTFRDTLESIDRQAVLLGPDFDAVSARIAATRAEMLRLAEANGVLDPTVQALRDKLNNLVDFQKTEDLFKDLFGSIQGGIAKVIEGLQLGTRSWQDWGKAALDVIRSVAAELINRLLRAALDPITDRLAKIATGAIFGTGGGGGAAGAGAGNGNGGGDAGGGWTGLPSGVPTSVLDPSWWQSIYNVGAGLWSAAGGAGGTLGPAFTGVGGIDVLAAGGSFTDAVTAFSAASSSVSLLTTSLAGVGAAVAAFGSIMDIANDRVEAGIGGLVGGGVLGAVGAYFAGPGGAFLGYAIGDLLGSWIGGMFGGPSNYELKRIAAADQANQALGGVVGGYQSALDTGDIAQILAALQRGAGGSGVSVRSELVLPAGLAGQIGITGQQIGDELVAQWSSLTLEQFEKVIAAFREQPDLVKGIRGSGDVPYLEQGDAQGIADQIAQGAQALLTAFISMDEVRTKITRLGDDLTEAATQILPPGLADTFAHGIVDPIQERMLAVLDSGLGAKEMQKQLDALSQELLEYVGLVALYGTVQQDIAKLSGDIAEQTKGAILTITTTLRSADRAVQDARSRAAEAITPGEVLTANAALRTAILDRYNTEAQLIAQIDKSIAALLESAGTVQDTLTSLAVADLAGGDATAFNEIYLSLVAMASDAPTVAQRLYAVGEGLDAILSALPTTVTSLSQGAGIEAAGGGSVSDAILDQVRTNVAPFFAALGDLIQQAADAGDLAGQLSLLQQQAQLIAQVGGAMVQAVQDWADAAIAATNTAASEMIDDINANWDAMEQFVNDTADAEEAALEARLDALRQELELAQRWAAALQSADDLVKSLEAVDVGAARARFTEAQTPFWPDRPTYRDRTGGRMPGGDAFTATPEDLQALVAAAQEYLDALTTSINDQIAALEAWQTSIDDMTSYIDSLDMSLLSLDERLARLAETGAQALADYTADPTAQGLADLRAAAQDYLDAFTNTINAQIDALRAWQDAIRSVDNVIASVRGAPDVGAALQAGTDAFNAYMLAPSAEGLAALSAAAQDYYSAAIAAEDARASAEMDAARAASDARIEGFQAEIEAAQDAARQRQDAIADEISALQDMVKAAREWEGVVKSLDAQLTAMQLGSEAPLNPADQLKLAQSNFAAAQAAFNASPSAAGASGVAQAAQDLLQAGQQVFTRPSPEYQDLFNSVRDVLQGVRGTAAGLAGPVSSADLEAQIGPLQEESKRIADATTETVKRLQEQIDAEKDALAAELAAIAAASQATKDAIAQGVIDALEAAKLLAPKDITQTIADLNKEIRDKTAEIADILREALADAPEDPAGQILTLQQQLQDITSDIIGIIRDAQAQAPQVTAEQIQSQIDLATEQLQWWKDWRQDQLKDIANQRAFDIDLVNQWKQAQINAIKETAETTINNIKAGTKAALIENSDRQNLLLGLLVDSQLDQLHAITEGRSEQEFMADAARRSRDALESIDANLAAYLDSIPGAAGGMAYVPRTMPVLVHEGERILTRQERLDYERGQAVPTGGRAASFVFSPTVNVTGGGDPAMTRALIADALRSAKREWERDLQSGALGRKLGESR